MRGLCVALVLLAGGLAEAQTSRPVGASLDDDLAAKLARMRVLMREGLDREEPSDPSVAGILALPHRTMFRGSYDRHSNIAAHWALLSWARRTADQDEARSLLRRFTVEKLQAERDYLESVGTLSEVRPYDDAWLLLLLVEIDRAADDDAVRDLARKIAAETEARILDFLDECRGPESFPASRPAASRPRISNPFRARTPWLSGAYDSPLWATLVLQISPPSCAEARRRLDLVRADRVPLARSHAVRAPWRSGFDFLWLDSMLWLSDALAADASAPCAAYDLADHVAPRKKITLANCHGLGREIVKLWPVAVKTAGGDAAARKLFNDRLRLCLEREDTWDGPFVTVSHWVPQFVYFAVWLADGRP
jgi:hypothetical protein